MPELDRDLPDPDRDVPGRPDRSDPDPDPDRPGAARRTLHRLRPFGLGIGFAVAVATVVGIGVALPGPRGDDTEPPAGLPTFPGHGQTPVPVPAQLALVGYDTCPAMLADLRAHAAASVTAWGLPNDQPVLYGAASGVPVAATGGTVPMAAAGSAAKDAGPAPEHSTTNDQEAGADEPDIVKTDGRRIVAVSDGVLQVVDAATRRPAGRLDLRAYAGADNAQLLLAGNRALVLLGQPAYYGPQYAGPQPLGGAAPGTGSTYLLVDLSGAPTVISTMHTSGSYVDARLIGGVARVVVDDAVRIAFPQPGPGPASGRRAANRRIVEHAPLSAWQPTYETSDGRVSTTHRVPCDRVSHPRQFTGDSMVTVYSFDPQKSLDDPHPVSIAADGTAVYATTTDLYVASADGDRTALHRFAVTGSGAPRYVGSGRVPGRLLDSYSLSEYDGALRVVTTAGDASTETSLYVLDAATLRRRGTVGGLGVGEQLHAVRFLGPLAYVVTFESVDPLYVLDLADPDAPRRAGELTVTGYSDYLHPVADGRLLGVGQDVGPDRRVDGLQVSLFDVSHPARPARLANVIRRHTPSETPLDPHAFLYWPATHEAVVPIDSWDADQSGAALVVRVGPDRLTVVGTLRNPAVTTAAGYDTGIERTLVLGGDVWTMSSSGLLVSDLQDLHRRGWVPFR
jgi:hypothetical protein